MTSLVLVGACQAPDAPGNIVTESTLSSSASPDVTDMMSASLGDPQHFFFLPPMEANPRPFTGVFDGALSPEVTICELAGNTCDQQVARFTMTSGPGSERVRRGDQHYIINWHTGNFAVNAANSYRIMVTVAGFIVGSADVQFTARAGKSTHIDVSQRIGLTIGQTLPIKFRIEEGLVAAVTVSPEIRTMYVGDSAMLMAVVTDLHGNTITDAPVTWASSSVAVADVNPSGQVTARSVGATTITATSCGTSGTAAIQVLRRPVASITVSPTTAAVVVGGTQSYTALLKDDLGNALTDRVVSWSVTSAPTGVASIDQTGMATGMAPGTATVIATSEGVSETATLNVSAVIEHPGFCSLDGLNAFGNATALPPPECVLRLAAADFGQAGGAWSQTKVSVVNGFETTFQFRMSDGGGLSDWFGWGADGFTFVIQTLSATAVGSAGGGLGYNGLPKSVAVEFDTWRNLEAEINDPDSNHISVQTNGLGPNGPQEAFRRGWASVPWEMIDDQVHSARITYVPGMMSVYLDGAVHPALTVPLDLQNIAGDNILDGDGQAWVGFTAATGWAWANHDILSWSVTPN